MAHKFRAGDRVQVTNQHSDYRHCLGTVVEYNNDGPKPIVMVKVDGGSRYSRNTPQPFTEQDLGPTTYEEVADHFVPPPQPEEEL